MKKRIQYLQIQWVYAQRKLRKSLKSTGKTLPNQLGKPVTNPTMRWVSQLMEGIAIVRLYDPIKQSFRAMITNLNDVRMEIIRLPGKTACLIYGIQTEIAGMQDNCFIFKNSMNQIAGMLSNSRTFFIYQNYKPGLGTTGCSTQYNQ